MRDYYNSDVDFVELAKDDKAFSKLYESSGGHLDWQDPQTVQTVTKALLRRDFNLRLSLPDDRLCPPVPVRWNYIRWIQELIDTTGTDHRQEYDSEREVVGLDVGVGASCIYGLLACAARPNWLMLGTDIDQYSLEYAANNIKINNLDARLKLKHCSPDSDLIPLHETPFESIDFVVCNPPFYSSEEDMQQAYATKVMSPSAVCTGSTNEMITPGGDLQFALRLLAESTEKREKVQWYSCMFGRLASAQQFVTQLKSHGISNFAATNLRAGQKTVRWAIAWSFSGHRPRNDVARHGSLIMALLPAATERTIVVPGMQANLLGKRVDDIMKSLALSWQYNPEDCTGRASAEGNVWSRNARRRRQHKIEMEVGSAESRTAALAIDMRCTDDKLDITWRRGEDAVLLESFVGMLKGSLGVRPGMY